MIRLVERCYCVGNLLSKYIREASEAVDVGASELDMVLNYELLKSKDYSAVLADIEAVRKMAPFPTVLKVILETSQLSSIEIIAACKIAQAAEADFVKTSTGFNGTGASAENVNLMKSVVQGSVKVKASGGVKTVRDCVRMMEAGAERIGTSSGVSIVKEAHGTLEDVTDEVGHSNQPSSKLRESPRILDTEY